jgi:hypothetical protein
MKKKEPNPLKIEYKGKMYCIVGETDSHYLVSKTEDGPKFAIKKETANE